MSEHLQQDKYFNLYSYISAATAYGEYICQLVRYSRAFILLELHWKTVAAKKEYAELGFQRGTDEIRHDINS